MGKSRDYEKREPAELKDTIRKLKATVGRRDKKIRQLISEIQTLQKALSESTLYIDEKLAGIPVEDIVKYFKTRKHGNLQEVQKAYKSSEEYLRKKWKCYECDHGYLRLFIINRPDGKHYFRSCNSCDNRTRLKVYTEDVDGAK